MASKRQGVDITPQDPAEEIDGEPAEPDVEPDREAGPAEEAESVKESAFPPAGHRSETIAAVRPDGTPVTVLRDIETGIQRITEGR